MNIQVPVLDINILAKAMEDMWSEKEATFAMAESLEPMRKTCPDHGCGARDIERFRYVCPFCNKVLGKK